MPSESARTALIDILHNIALAERFSDGLGREAFFEDIKTIYAVTRALEIISEASRRLPDELKQRHPEIAWRQMAGAGNVFRHDYDHVAARYIWDTLRNALPPLKAAVEAELG